MPEEVLRWKLAEEFGWSLEYIDGLSLQDILDYISIEDGKAHVRKSIINK